MIPKSLLIFVCVGIVSGFAVGSYLLDVKQSSQLVFVDGPGISVVTEKSDFKKGEPIKIKIVNSGTVPLEFSDASYGLRIAGLTGVLMYSPVSAQVITEMQPKEEVEIVWDQIKNNGDAALEGLYKISTNAVDSQGNNIGKSITIHIWK